MNPNVPRRTEIWVGIFIILSMSVLFFMVIFMAGEQKLFADRFEVRAIFSDVQGLRVGAPVMLSGLQCGTVRSIRFTPGGQLLVIIQIRKEFREHVREDSIASIGTIGLLGDKSVEITAGSVGYAVLEEGATLQTLPSMTFAETLNRSRPVFDALGQTFANLQTITDKLGGALEDLGGAMSEVKKLTARINRGEGSMGRFISDEAAYRSVSRSLEEMRTFAERLNSPEGTLGKLISDPKLHDEALLAIENVGRTAQAIQKLSRDAMPVVGEAQQFMGEGKEAASEIRGILQKVDRIANDLVKASARWPDLMTEARQLLEDARGTLRDAREVVRAAKDHWIIRPYLSEPEPVVVIHEPR